MNFVIISLVFGFCCFNTINAGSINIDRVPAANDPQGYVFQSAFAPITLNEPVVKGIPSTMTFKRPPLPPVPKVFEIMLSKNYRKIINCLKFSI